MSTTDYSGMFVYKDGHIDYVQTSEGRMKRATNGIYNAEYFIKDHLGNVRVVYSTISGPSQVTDYYPFGLEIPVSGASDNKIKYNSKELQTDAKLDWYDYGARFYDPIICRWTSVDPMAQAYDNHSPYTYVLNNPINAIDPDGKLIIFVNGFMTDQWLKQDNNNSFSFSYGYGALSGQLLNPNYSPYPSERAFSRNAPEYLGKSFEYWGNEKNVCSGIGGVFSQVYKDYNSLFISASAGNSSQAGDRFSEGITAAKDLIAKLDNGEISLNDGETIKIISHSQGAAFAAGMATVLAKDQKYSAVLEAIHYIAPHQPGDFAHPSNISGYQWSTKSDWVSSKWTPLMWFNGGSELAKISGIKDENYHLRESYQGERGGHSVNTYLDAIVDYYRALGISVTVYE